MLEESLKLLWPVELLEVTGKDFMDKLNSRERSMLLDLELQLTVGDRIKELVYDKHGKVIDSAAGDELRMAQATRIP